MDGEELVIDLSKQQEQGKGACEACALIRITLADGQKLKLKDDRSMENPGYFTQHCTTTDGIHVHVRGAVDAGRNEYAIYVLQALGDLVVTSQVAKQIKADDPNAYVVWFVLRKNSFILKGNPYIDELVELEGNNRDLDQRIEEFKLLRPWKRFLVPQPHLAYDKLPGGDLSELTKAAVGLEWTVPYVPVMRLNDAEIARARDYVAQLPAGLKIMVETEFQSDQTPWNVDYAKVMIHHLRHLNPIFIFSAKNEPSYLAELRSQYDRVEWCQLPFRENAELYNLMDAFIGVSSGISCLTYSDWCKTDVPHIEVVNNTHWSTYHFDNHTRRRLCFEEQSFVNSLQWLTKVLDGRLTGFENPQVRRMDLYSLYKEGKYSFFCKTIIPSTYALKEDLRSMALALRDFPDFYLICGDIDDAMMTLSRALDEHKLINVVVCSKYFDELRPFFDEHSIIRNVFVIPFPDQRTDAQTHLILQMAFQKNCLGVGVKSLDPGIRGHYEDLRIQELLRFKSNPKWATRNHHKTKTLRIVVEASGAPAHGHRSERAIINPRWWRSLIELMVRQGVRPIIIGDPAYSSVYSVDERCEDVRRESSKRQLAELRQADVFIGSDGKYMTVAALMSIHCLRCVPLRGHDLSFYDDPLLRGMQLQWKNLDSSDSFEELQSHVQKKIDQFSGHHVDAQLLRNMPVIRDFTRRTNPNEVLSSFNSVFWERSYASKKTVLLRCSTALGDSLMTTGVVAALKAKYPHLSISVSGSEATMAVFVANKDVDNVVLRNSAGELLLESAADEIVEFNTIIDQFPEYYNGIHLSDILGNIAGVKLQDRRIHYTPTEAEQHMAAAAMDKVFGSASPQFVVGLHLFTEKDTQRSYRHANGLIEYLQHLYPNICIVNFGKTSFRKQYNNVLDCPRYANIGLREQIALVQRCHTFISIDSAFFHVAHNLFNKPTLAIQSVVNEFLTGDPDLGNVRTVRNTERGCRGCYWVPGVCKSECLPKLHPSMVAVEFTKMIEDIQQKKMPFAKPCLDTEIMVEYDALGKNLARVYRSNAKLGKNISVVLKQGTDPMPDYVRDWNGVRCAQSSDVPSDKLIDSKELEAQSQRSASALAWN